MLDKSLGQVGYRFGILELLFPAVQSQRVFAEVVPYEHSPAVSMLPLGPKTQ